MKYLTKVILSLSFLPIFVFCEMGFAADSASIEKVRLANWDWPPYQSRFLKHNGFGSHIMKDAFAAMGVETEFFFTPVEKGYQMAKDGRLDGTFFWQPDEIRAKTFIYSDPVLEKGLVFFHLQDAPFEWTTIEGLNEKEICAVAGKSYGDVFDLAVSIGRITVNWTGSDIECFQAILSGAADIFPIDPEKGHNILRSEFPALDRDKVAYHHKFLPPHSTLHLLVSKYAKNGEKTIQIFNAGLKKLKESGKLQVYISKSLMGAYDQ